MSNLALKEDRAAYRILAPNGFYGSDDHLYIETAESGPVYIYWDEEPNEEMEPINELARQRMAVYLDKLETLGRDAALKAGKAFAGRPRTLDGQLELASALARAEAGEMGNKNKEAANIERIEAPRAVQETGVPSVNRPKGRPSGKGKGPALAI